MSGTRRPRIHAVVIAGGAGTRFWPLSRRERPKPLLEVDGHRTLLAGTVARARRFAEECDVWLVCGAEHVAAMRREAGLRADRVLVEPRMRNTAAAVGLAAHRIAAVDPEGLMAVLPADHRIPDGAAFARAIRLGARAAVDHAALVTLGVRPTRPETGYGYIRLARGAGPEGVQRVARFVEKPDAARARRYVAGGNYLWNAGVFVWQARALLAELVLHAPAIARALAPLGAPALRGAALRRAIARCYRRVPARPIDKAVLERSSNVWCLPVDFRWSDVGTWSSLATELGVGDGPSRVLSGDVLLRHAEGNLVHADGRQVVLLGVTGLAVIDTGDALLIADLERSSEVRDVVASLERRGRRELL